MLRRATILTGLLLSVSLIVGCGKQPREARSIAEDLRMDPVRFDHESRRVYQTLIAVVLNGKYQTKAPLLIQDRTTKSPCFQERKSEEQCTATLRDNLWNDFGNSLLAETREDFIRRSAIEASLGGILVDSTSYKLVSAEAITSLFESGRGWNGFAATFPSADGFFDVSAVGFDPAMKQAVVYYGHHCGLLCGDGNYVFLTNDGHNWVVVKEAGSWVS